MWTAMSTSNGSSNDTNVVSRLGSLTSFVEEPAPGCGATYESPSAASAASSAEWTRAHCWRMTRS